MKMRIEDALAVGFACGGLELAWFGCHFGILPMVFIGLPMIFASVLGFALNRVEDTNEAVKA
ncbi:MAG: hypothetical protein ACI381_03230 [Candidatus Methanomethylophilaceae archaeon]